MYDLGARWLTAQGEAHPGSRVSKRWVRMRINEQYRPDGWLGFKRNVREDLL
ncbi:MAG: hypothetical protein JWM12_974 [Ilumatobacteraceae bacterium]|nr:hypothetical protein [Ilumatobacteraceae bacterium]